MDPLENISEITHDFFGSEFGEAWWADNKDLTTQEVQSGVDSLLPAARGNLREDFADLRRELAQRLESAK